MTAWTDLVKKVYNENKSKPGYKLKNAMRDAKKIYKKTGTNKQQPKSRRGTRKSKSRRRR